MLGFFLFLYINIMPGCWFKKFSSHSLFSYSLCFKRVELAPWGYASGRPYIFPLIRLHTQAVLPALWFTFGSFYTQTHVLSERLCFNTKKSCLKRTPGNRSKIIEIIILFKLLVKKTLPQNEFFTWVVLHQLSLLPTAWLKHKNVIIC